MMDSQTLRAPRRLRGVAALGVLTFLGAACTDSSSDAPIEGAVAEDPAPIEGVHGMAPPAVGGTPSVVVLRPAPSASATGRVGETPRIDQLGLAFTPTQLIVTTGETVAFTNSETIGHNVHVRVTDVDSTVLLVDTDPGGRAELVFEREGGYDVTCDEHPGMRAFIYVTSSPYAVFAERDGWFRIPDVPPGSYTASVWSVDPSLRIERQVEVSGAGREVNLVPGDLGDGR